MIGCLPRVLEVPRVVDDTEVPRILWVKCATSVECQTILIAVSTVKDSWVVLLRLRPYVSGKQHGVVNLFDVICEEVTMSHELFITLSRC